jgi:hypothetical protein
MTRVILTSILLLVLSDATVIAAPMTKAAERADVSVKAKKRRGFKSMMVKSVGFVASSVVIGGMSDR